MSASITVVGTLAADPKLITTGNGTEFCTFRIASNERRFDRAANEWVSTGTSWFSVAAFRGLGQHAKQSFKQGHRVIVTGRVRVREWESEQKGTSGTSVEIDAEALGHDLLWGRTHFRKLVGPIEEYADDESPTTGAIAAPPDDAGAGAEGGHRSGSDPSAAGWPGDNLTTDSSGGFSPEAGSPDAAAA